MGDLRALVEKGSEAEKEIENDPEDLKRQIKEEARLEHKSTRCFFLILTYQLILLEFCVHIS